MDLQPKMGQHLEADPVNKPLMFGITLSAFVRSAHFTHEAGAQYFRKATF